MCNLSLELHIRMCSFTFFRIFEYKILGYGNTS